MIIVHILVCILLSLIILMQSGRGGGLTEGFAAAESMFGAKTNIVLVKATTVLASMFLVTCLGLAFLSTQQSKSLIADKPATERKTHSAGMPLSMPADGTKEGAAPPEATTTPGPDETTQPQINSEEKKEIQPISNPGETNQP